MAEQKIKEPEGIKMPKGAAEREKWNQLVDRVATLEKLVAEIYKKGPRAK